MSYKPTNEELMAYLYGEQDESQRAQIEQYLNDNPEARTELEGMEETRVVMSQWEDEEVPLIPGFMQPHENSEWLYWRKYVAIAASILLVIGFGSVSGFQAGYDGNGFRLGFGKSQPSGISMEEVNQMLAEQQQDLLSQMLEMKDGIDGDIESVRISNDNVVSSLQDQQINSLINEQKQEIVSEMNKLSDKMTEDYREIFRQLVVSFSNNMQDQRIQDLRKVELAFNDLQDVIGTKQEALEEALYNLSVEVDALAQNND